MGTFSVTCGIRSGSVDSPVGACVAVSETSGVSVATSSGVTPGGAILVSFTVVGTIVALSLASSVDPVRNCMIVVKIEGPSVTGGLSVLEVTSIVTCAVAVASIPGVVTSEGTSVSVLSLDVAASVVVVK